MKTRAALRLAAVVAAAALAWPAAPAGADDRNLLRESGADPYVMILFDTSGSMNWAPRCTLEDYNTFYDHDGNPATPDIRRCNYVCEPRDCPVPRDGDDPNSKFRQAKEALYEVVQRVDNVRFGFSSYNQDDLHVNYKHWLYRVAAGQPLPVLQGGDSYPAPGMDWVFGPTLNCDSGNGDRNIACYANNDNAADTNDLWEITRANRYPKGGTNGTTAVSYYVRSGGRVYYVYVDDPGSAISYGASTIGVRLYVARCTGNPLDNPTNGCNSSTERTEIFDATIQLSLVGDYVMWDFDVDRTPPQNGFWDQVYSSAGQTCEGWEPNNDDDFGNTSNQDDRYRDSNGNEYNLKLTTVNDPQGRTLPPGANANDFDYGDVIPMDWLQNNKLDVLNRLAPRLNGGDPATDPEAFAVATYLEDSRVGSRQFLRAKSEAQKPLVPNGSTPLLYSMRSFRNWYRGCDSGSCSGIVGWDDVAAVNDSEWECRRKYLIILTDGDDTCSSENGCSIARTLKIDDDITTYVVAFGVEGVAGNKLSCIATEGGTGEPIYPQNKAELVDALTDIFKEIREQSAAFASAAVPTVQANVADKIFLSSFIPLNDEAVWPGRVDAFLKPLPLDDAGLPDLSVVCGAGDTAGCWLWDAGDSQPAWDGEAGYDPDGLLTQSPLAGDIVAGDNATLKIGNGQTERRVYFGLPNDSAVSGKRQLYQFPTSDPEQSEFEWVWNLSTDPADDAANLATIQGIVSTTLQQKQGEITDPVTGAESHVQYLLGDVFHADPGLLDQPEEFDFYTKDLYRNQALCGQTVAQTNQRTPPVSYRYFADKNACRRKVLFVASNDAQLHAFDAGIFRGSDCKFPVTEDRDGDGAPDGDGDGLEGNFDNGSGKEIFSFIPARMMPTVKSLATTVDDLASSGVWGVDGTVRIADVFLDPVHSGTPTCTDRQWRTVLIGGYREGGTGYYALDVTQPDAIDDTTNVPAPLGGSAGFVPSCTDGGIDCGPLPFPAKLWEFKDSSDEDGSFADDLGETWSRPVVERLRICLADCGTDTAQLEDRWVAIFGGGLPGSPTNSDQDTVGNWLYMVDVETGEILYKRGGVSRMSDTDSIVGAVPSDITTVDYNGNGYIETIYFGTTAGYLYKVALGEGPFELGVDGRIADPVGEDGRYDPFQVFSTGGRPIYYEPTAVYVPKLRAVALAFGTGNRWDLWDFDSVEGRFYVIADTGWQDSDRDGLIDQVCGTCPQPLTESQYQAVGPDDSFDPLNPPPDYLLDTSDATPGWYLTLEPDDRIITEAFSLSGITVFTAYAPRQTEEEGVCAQGGESKIFVVGTTNAIGYARPAGGDERTRYTTASTFTTSPSSSRARRRISPGAGHRQPPISARRKSSSKSRRNSRTSIRRAAGSRSTRRTSRPSAPTRA